MKTSLLSYTLIVLAIGAGGFSLLSSTVAAACDEASDGAEDLDTWEEAYDYGAGEEPVTLRCPKASDPAQTIAVEIAA